jgi:hypothetical protein
VSSVRYCGDEGDIFTNRGGAVQDLVPTADSRQAGVGVGASSRFSTYLAFRVPVQYLSGRHSSSTPGVFHTHFYNHAHRLRLEKLL